ncbi:MAG: aldehyde dehydrogenase [Verrucomicrobia bacterium]|nr:aldehyde dehydrogenase [Verrucomicrobiota bacterium]
MASDSLVWRIRSPGNLDLELDEIHRSDPGPMVDRAHEAFRLWRVTPLTERIQCLRRAAAGIEKNKDELAEFISIEVGKPIREARGELAAVLAKFELSFEDAAFHLAARTVQGGPHPAEVRARPRGAAAVVAPFNFPIHLGHGAAIAHLLAGNTVLFKPSPLAAHVGAKYGAIMSAALPEGVFQVVQGGAEVAIQLCSHPRVRAVCFTGSSTAGRNLARLLADDFSKDLALELGGKNAALILSDADIGVAARAVVEGMNLTAGQRCNSTSRALVHESLLNDFLDACRSALAEWVPGDPIEEETRLGPVVDRKAWERHRWMCGLTEGCKWVIPGSGLEEAGGLRGHYVTPGVAVMGSREAAAASPLCCQEIFTPVLAVQGFTEVEEAVSDLNCLPYGLTCSVFTRSDECFRAVAADVDVANVYMNLPTTFSPSTLPFGGWKESGNGRPGGKGFIRYTTQEQALQWRS